MIQKAILFSLLIFILKGSLCRSRAEQTSSVVSFIVLLQLLVMFSFSEKSIYLLFPVLLCLSLLVFLFLYKDRERRITKGSS